MYSEPFNIKERLKFAEFWQNGWRARAGVPIAVAAAITFALAALWQWSPLGEWLNLEALQRGFAAIESSGLTPPLVLAVYLLAGATAFPITLLIIVTALVFGPVWGVVYAVCGSLSAAALGYAIGRKLGQRGVKHLAGTRFGRLRKALRRRGVLAIAAIRTLPLAPFLLINLLAGALQLRLRDFLLGTLLGMAPGILALTVFADGVMTLLMTPDPVAVAASLGAIALAALLAWLLRRRLRPAAASDRSS